MSFRLFAPLFFLALSLSLTSLVLSQSKSIANPLTSSQVKEFAIELVGTASEEEQELLLVQKKALINSQLRSELKALADPFAKRGDDTNSLRISQIEVRVAEKIGDRIELGIALIDLGLIHERFSRTSQALECFQKSLTIFEEAEDKKGKMHALLNIGIVYESIRRFDQAIDCFKISLAISEEVGDRSVTARALSYMGYTYGALERQDLGLELCLKGRAVSEELNDLEALDLVLNFIATYYIDLGRYSEALECLEKCLKINEELGSASDKKNLASRLINIGLIYRRQGRTDQALAYYLKSLKILEEFDDKFGIANIQNNIGVVYKVQGGYDQALEWFQKSLQRYEIMRFNGGIARGLNNIGSTYCLQGRYDQALDLLLKSLNLREKNNDRGGMILTLNNLSRVYYAQGKYSEMIEASQRSAKLGEELNARDELWNAQNNIGRAQLALGQLAEAQQSFLAAIRTIESLSYDVAGGEKQQQSFFESRLSPWLSMIALLVSQQEYIEALTIAEQSKARVLTDVLQTGQTKLHKSLSSQELQMEEQKRQKMVTFNSQLISELRRDKPNPARVTELKKYINNARLDFEAFETSLYAAHPELKVDRGKAEIITKDSLASLLPNTSTAILEYVVTDDKTFLFIITKALGKSEKNDIKVHTLSIKRSELIKDTESFRRQLAERDLGFRSMAGKLYDLMLKPAEAQLRGKTNLIIVPDDKLWDLPFQALINNKGKFLIENAAIAYAPSLTVLREMIKRQMNRPKNISSTTLLALGNPLLGDKVIERESLVLRGEKLTPLPEAEEEVKKLKTIYGAAQSKIYLGAQAREDRVKAEASQVSILHFATHGILDNSSPMYSYLVLAQGDKNQDGLLEAWEIMQLDLKADLAVLSACDTSRGHFSAGEGVIGFTWALFIAGVPSTVVSQWKVESASTRNLMIKFHRLLRILPKGKKTAPTKAEALRFAALQMMKNPEMSHPFYWAGFVLIGNGR